MSGDPQLLSVVIPARNNRGRLASTLDSIASSDADLSRVEVVVADDGSDDGTWEALGSWTFPFSLRICRGDWANQSAATNAAIRRASGTFVLSSASDIIFDRSLVARHLAWHEKYPEENIVVLGHLPYAEHLDVTPFMFYLVNGGYQFAFFLIRDVLNVPPNFLYAPNFSVKRELLDRVEGFDERFPFGCQDTDLGIRLVEAGARIIYDPEAIGYHNHPVEMEGYLRRQEMAGRALVHLADKHPDYEGGLGVWDMAIQQFLMYSVVDYDRDLEVVRRGEAGLAGDTTYQPLWVEGFCRGKDTDLFTENERTVLRRVNALFRAYTRILGFHWGKGYIAEHVRVHGGPATSRRIRARLAKGQASLQVWKVIEKRLREQGLEPPRSGTGNRRVSIVVHGLHDYLSALQYLEPFQDPPARRCNYELVLVVERSALSPEEASRLEEVVDVVAADSTDEGVLEAIGKCRAEVIAVTSAGVEPVHGHAHLVAEKLFHRMPSLAILGGSLPEPGGSARRYGYRRSGEPLAGGNGSAPELTTIDVAIPEFCVLHGPTVKRLLETAGEARRGPAPWNHSLCDLAARQGRLVLHVPELEARHQGEASPRGTRS